MRKTDTLPYAAIAVGLSISAIMAAVYLARLHPVPVVRAGALDVTAAAFWLLTSGLGVTSSSLSVKFFIFQMGFFGIVLVPPCWLALSLIISGYERFVNRRNILALSVMPIITLALVFTNGYHGLMYGRVQLNPADPMLPLNLTPGLAFGGVVVAYSYALDGAGIVVLMKRLLVSRRSFRPQIYLLLAASLIPWLTNMVYLSAQNLFGYVEPTSLTLTVAGAIVMWRTAHWSGLYVAPIAHEVMIDNMNDPVIVLDYEKRVVDVNPMAEKLIRRSHSELVGEPIESAWSEWSRISKVMEDKTSIPKELAFDNGDMRRYYELEESRLPGFTSEEVNLLITMRDITERKRAEEALHRSEEKYRTLVENINDIVLSVNAAGRLTYVSPAVERVLGYRVDELIGQPFSRFVVPGDLDIITSRFGRVLAGDVEPFEYRVLDKNGGVRYVQSSSRTQTEAGKVVGITGVLIDITESRKMQAELQKHTEHLEQLVEERTAELATSERKYRLLVDNMADVVFTIDLEGNYTFCTPQAEKMTGYTTQQLLSMNMSELIAPEDLSRVLKSLELRMRVQTELPPIRFDIVRANGTRLPIEVKTSLQLEGDKLVGVHGVARDITERKRMEDALRESESRFRELAELLPQPVLELDKEGKFTFVNRAAFTLSGYTEEDMQRGINALDLVVPEDQERLAKMMMGIASGEDTPGGEYTVVRRDGSTFPVFMHAARVMHGNEFVGFRAIAVDIRERKAAEEELQKLASVVRYSSELVNLATLDGKMIFLNEAGAKMLGIDSEEVQRVNIMQVIPDHLKKKAENEVLPALMNGHNWEGDLQYRNLKTGRLTDVHATTFTIKDPTTGKPLYLANVSLDITERKRLEAQLAESQRLAVIGETTTMVGHDLRNPLQAMSGTLFLAKELAMSNEVEDRKEAVRWLGKLDDTIRYMDKIVSDLQDYARPVRADPVEANVPDLVRTIVSNLKIPQNVEVTVDIQDGSSNLRLDPVLFNRVLTNLILNAVQAMPKGGRLTIAGSTEDGSLTVAVRDTGVGIAPENLAKIFNPFFTTKAQGQGLGLAVCKRLVEAQNGTITVKSEIGCGSTFTLKIPTNKTTLAS